MPLPPQKELTIGNFKLELDGFDRDGKKLCFDTKLNTLVIKLACSHLQKLLLKSPEGGEYKNQKRKRSNIRFQEK